MRDPEEFSVLIAAARRYLEDRVAAGETSVVLGRSLKPERSAGEPQAANRHGREPDRGRATEDAGSVCAATATGGVSGLLPDVEVDRKALADVAQQVSACLLCSLSEHRTQTVFGSGSGRTGLVFIGEAPGRDEDLQGAPFVGRAGQLLTRIIEAIKFKREDVYITNVVKCRPEDNRDPRPDEVEACTPYLARQLELLKPRAICALGRHAAEALGGVKMSMAEYRRAELSHKGIPVIATYHPAACLRNPDLKKLVWEDVQKLRDVWKNSG